MGWIYVILSAILETIGVVGLKKFSTKKTITSALTLILGFGGAFVLLYASFDYLQVSVAYAVWIGIGTTAAVLINIIFFNESKDLVRIVAVMIIVIGVSGLKYVS